MRETLLNLGIKKRNKEITLSWQQIADTYSDGMFTSGENFRCWVKEQLRKKGELGTNTKNPTLEDASSMPNYKEEIEIHKDGSIGRAHV
jgi:hypothetical protein